ncbi:MAG TPA: hypothetical protein VHE10_03090 [Candidatus Paceibacterota bacterium]|nr:hypothetical protein [Candidatus Paceibacterota bacterium]
MADHKNGATGAIIAGIAGLTAAAVGAYYLYGHEDAAKNRAKVKSWMLKAKGEVLDELESVRDVTESAYMSAVDVVAQKYRELKNIDQDELAAFITEMKGHWQGIRKTFESHASPLSAKKSAKAVAKPSGRKAPRTPRKK